MTKQTEYPEYDALLAELGEQKAGIITARWQNLVSAHERVKEENVTLKDSVTTLTKQTKGNEQAEATIADLQGKLSASEKKSSFFEGAPKECSNVKLAYALATSDSLFDKNGDADWKKIKESAPELFTKVVSRHDAGSGTGQGSNRVDKNAAANAAIRGAVGN